MPATVQPILIQQGKTFILPLQWETEPFLTMPIASITQAASVRITAAGLHNIPDGWRVAVVDAKGMTNLNAGNNPPKGADFRRATVVSSTAIEFNGLSSAAFKSHTANSGYLQWYTPHELTGYTARMAVKDKLGGAVLLSLTTENGGIEINPASQTITLTISATDTAAITWAKGVYDLELVSPDGVVTAVLAGAVSVSREITT